MSLQLINGGKASLKTVQCAGAVVTLGRGFIVLVRPLNNRDEWLLPKGHVEEGESLITAALREAREETGAEVVQEVEEPLRVTTYEDQAKEETKQTTWYLLRAVALKTENAEPVMESIQYRRPIGIFPPLVALAKLTYQDHREVLCMALGGV